MTIKTFKVFSYCDDIPEELQDGLDEYNCGVYVPYTAFTEQTLKEGGYRIDEIAILLHKLGANDGEEVLIDMDY